MATRFIAVRYLLQPRQLQVPPIMANCRDVCWGGVPPVSHWPAKKKARYLFSSGLFNGYEPCSGSSTWARTRDLRINSTGHPVFDGT